MVILGINISGFHSSACLLVDGKIKSAITEERLTRVKRDKSFPKKSIQYCCKAAGINLEEVTDIFIGWNPKYYLGNEDSSIDAMRNRGRISYLALNELSSLVDNETLEIKEQIKFLNSCWNIHFVNHHDAHLSNSFFQSGFNNSDFIVLDGFGEVSTGCIGHVTGKKIEKFSDYRTPHSLGSFYSAFTDFLGFHPNGDEWKVMALASLGNADKYYEKIRSLIKVNDINFELDLSYFEHFLFFTPKYYSPKLIEQFGDPADGETLTQRHYDIVASVQKVCEEVVLEIINNLYNRTKSKNLVVAGGFFMNSVVNGKILDASKYKNIYIGGSPDDSGIGTGSALYGCNYVKNHEIKPIEIEHNYFGRNYSDSEIENELKKRKIKYLKINDLEKETAKLLKNQLIVAWFQGKSEFGQRALGNRSIIADPTCARIKDLVNSSIKYRESFRPFAPSVLSEDQSNLFIMEKKQNSYFMERVFNFKPEFEKSLPAVFHFDGTGRLQTVKRTINPKYHKLISEFKKLSGFGVILNTSFNINGMPLVETPSDAIDCFYQSGIDVLVMNNYVVKKTYS